MTTHQELIESGLIELVREGYFSYFYFTGRKFEVEQRIEGHVIWEMYGDYLRKCPE